MRRSSIPVVSEFEGIEICFYFDDHRPPHFHAKYAGQEALVEIENSCVLKGYGITGKNKST